MDFVHDQLYDGTKIRVLTVIDAFTRYVPAIDVRRSYTGADVVDTLERVCAELGYPKSVRIDQGPEFISKDLDLWAYAKGVELDFSRPGKPTDNAFIESLNGKFRAECLNAHWFMNLADARRKCESWRIDYNTCRPHSSIGYNVPADLMKGSGHHAHLEPNRRNFLTPTGPRNGSSATPSALTMRVDHPGGGARHRRLKGRNISK